MNKTITDRIIQLYKLGKDHFEIARILRINPRTILEVIKKIKDEKDN